MIDGLGLNQIGDLTSLLDDQDNGLPQQIDLNLIVEDLDQPRKTYDENSLQELAISIKERGVKQPISVRNWDNGKYIINFGHRRYRASLIAGKKTIPAFIDNDFLPLDQLTENVQRKDLEPLEIANFIAKLLSEGMKKNEIASLLGKSPAYVTQYSKLLNLPQAILEIFENKKCQDISVINELSVIHKKNPDEVEEWIKDENQEINRNSVSLLRDFLIQDNANTDSICFNEKENIPIKQLNKKTKKINPTKFKKAIIQVSHFNRPGQLVLTKKPSALGLAWIRYDDIDEEVEISLSDIKITALIEAC